MKYIDEYRSGKAALEIAEIIRKEAEPDREYRFMEVCGTHTVNIFKFAIESLLPENIKMISGPGCPVCVTPISEIDRAIYLSKQKGNVVATFGDMVKVPGSGSVSLYTERARGGHIKVIYSPMEALNYSLRNPGKRVILLAVGFETTAPTVAVTLKESKKKNAKNFFVYCLHKVMPPALKEICSDNSIKIDGFMLPGHVSVILGSGPYEFLSAEKKKACVITGFEPVDILQALLGLIRQVNSKTPKVDIEYKRAVKKSGNKKARALIHEVFQPSDSSWRGFGSIEGSGLKIRTGFSEFDIEKMISYRPKVREPKGCICAQVLSGKKTPVDCRLFAKTCTPREPVGACMVSAEGVCAAYYRYKRKNIAAV
jgi:hydrogenase expression/formation protein HypD